MITIYDKDGNTRNVPLTKEAVHEQELMKSNFIRLSWNDRSLYTIPVGSYIMHEGVKYMLLDPYTPKQNRHKSFTYTPEFQHPIMWLGRIPFYTTVNDPTTHEDVKRYDWTYANYPQTIIDYLKDFVNTKVALPDIGTNWRIDVDPKLPTTGVVPFGSLDVLSAAAAIANTFDCQYNFDFQSKVIRFGNFREGEFALSGAAPVTLRSGENIGVANVSESKEDYHNAYFVQGSTKNLSKLTTNGDNVQVTNRLTLPTQDSIIYVNDNGQEITKAEFEALGVPLCAKSLIFDEVFPKYNLYLYNIRERRCWLLDENGNKIGASESDGWKDGDNWYKYYSKWYFRFAYYTNQPVTGSSPIRTEVLDGKTYYWYEYELKDNVKAKVNSKDKSGGKNRLFTELPYIFGSLTDNNVTITCNNVTDTEALMDFTQDAHAVFYVSDALYNAVSSDNTLIITGGLDSTKFDEKYRDSLIIKDKVLSLAFQPNYYNTDGHQAEESPLTSREFELVYFNQDKNEKESDDIEESGFNALKGDFRIVPKEDSGILLPTTSKGGLYPQQVNSNPSILNNIATLVNVVVDNTSLVQAQSELKEQAMKQIAYYTKDLNKYSFPTDPVKYREEPLSLFIGQRATYNNGQEANGGEDYELPTQIIKLVTRLDKPEITNISVGNEKAKGVISTMKEQIETIITGGIGTGESGGGGGITESQFLQLLTTHGDKRYIRRDVNDETNTNLTANNFIAKEGVKTDKIGGKTGDVLEVEDDLQVDGDASVDGDTELNGDVTIGASASNEAIVNAVMQVLAQMKSQNYVDDNPIGKGGWNLLSADDNGNSYMVIDKLFVRLKAIFNELEIRKISYAGGNIILSHAGSEIVGVKPLYRNGAVYAYRCYCKKDDGTTATENWWKVDDQAKCQTFNIQEGAHQNVENTYYWRKVIAVGSEIASLDGTTSEELYNYADLSLGDCDANSDIHKAGDSIIQMGNRTDTERQGFISLEVFGSDAPAFKVYKGVNGYNLNNKMPIVISPKNTSMKVQHYEIETDYGVFPAVKERGEWDLISNHRCYYFDRVQHNGSSWLCTYPQGSTPKYTTEEPSVNATYWKVDAQAGESAPSYTEEWYAWSNVQSVVNATTEPTPNGGWYQVIGGQGEYAYLWKKLIRYTWNSATRVYVAGTEQYYRMSGTNGTSISVKGSVATVADLPSTHADGDAYVVEADHHLYMWSDESRQWLDIGEFKGEDGKTYYTHIAWATSVTTNPSTGEVTNVTGFTIAKTADDTTHLWMGVYVDENSAADPNDALLYTWSYTKGVDGTSVSVDTANSKTQYAASTSSTVTPSSWQDTMPTVPQGQFLWTKVITAFTDGKSTVSYGVSYRGTDGDDVQIDTSRTYVRYSTVKTASQPADSTFTRTTPPSLSEGDYLWSLSQTAYVGVSSVLKSYSVSRLGIDGDEGEKGADGYTTHFAYATSADGSQNFSTINFAGATFIGTYKDDESADSQVYTDYVWTPWKGDKGDSITKSSETSTYKVSDSGTTTPTGTWYNTKSAADTAYAWSVNRYMWTKTVITWSDNSTTTLYSAERNPDDGLPGMSIVIDSQSVTYSKQTSGNLDPETLTYGSYPSSLSKGDWLYSKTTVVYKKSDGASAGSTNSYSVSYIGTDGNPGRAITGITEHYKASANATGETTPTSTDWSTTPTPSDWGASKPYLWNYEKITYSSGTTVQRTTASVVAIWTKDGAGIDSITNYYLATSASSGVTPSTSGWTTTVQAMTETDCYLWNYEVITYTQGKSSTSTNPHIIGHYGRDGEVITKDNETYRYATNNTGTRPDASSSSWKTTKPTLQKGYWLYTETTIHWSNNTETVLYTSERNPNDGAAGQSIIVDGSTVMKYYVGSSSTTHPAEDSSDWKDLDQVTQTQGMWLWSKSTTYYRKANSTSGSHDAGSSVQYNVSYIAEDGDTPEAARGVESVTEYYKATNSSSPMSKPTSDSGWDTDPNLSNLTNKWSETYKYLWNYEKVTYNKAPLVERTIPQILAIWTKNGDTGKGIDSITNYYLINNSSTAPSRPSTDGTGGWSTTPTPPNSSNPYLWNYEKIVWLNPSSTTYTDVQMIGHYGKDGKSVQAQYSSDGTSWHDAFATGDEWMRTRTTGGSWSDAMKIVGESGEDGDYTDFTFGISQYLTTANVNTAPADISSWSDAPLATTDEKPYLWSKQVKHTFNNGTETTSTPKYIRLTGEQGESAISSISLASHDIYFAQNNSGTNAPTSGWGTGTLTPTAENKYVWRKDVYTYDAQEYGRNLQPNTSEIPLGTGSFSIWADTGASYSTSYITDDLPVGAEKAIVLTSNASPRFHLQGKVRSLEAKNLTVSCWVKTSAANTSVRLYNCWSSTISGSYYKDFTIGTEWTHIEHTYKIPTAGTYTVALVSLQPDQSGRSMSVCGIKVEYGDEATDWCIAPEDLNSEDVYVWAVYGENAVQLTLDNQHEDFLYSESNANQPIAPQNGATSQAHLFDGATEKSATWEVSVNGGSSYVGSSDSFSTGSVAKAKISSSGLLTVAEIYVATAVIKVRATYNGNDYYYADFTANKTSQDRYELKVTPSSIAYNSSETWTNKTISLSAERTDFQGGKSTPSISTTANSGNLRVFTAWVNSNGSLGTLSRLNATTKTIGSSDASTYMGIYVELRWYFNSSTADSGAATTYRVCDFETVEIAKTANGATGPTGKGIVLDLKRDNYTEAQWNSWCRIGNNGDWSKNTAYDPADLDFTTAIRVGDYFTISGTATDSGLLHASIHRCTSITSSTKIYGTCTSHVKSGENGTSPLIIDTDNDADQFGTDSTGATGSVAQNKTANVTMYYGSTAQSLTGLTATVYQASAPTTSIGTATTTGSSVSANVTIGTSVVGFITVSYSGTQGTVTLQIKKNITINADFIVKITGTCSRGSKDINFTVQQVKSGAAGDTPIIYQINPTATSFSFNRTDDNGLTPASLSSQIRVDKTEGNTTTTISSAISGVTYSWGYDSNSASGTGLAIGTSITISNTDADSHRNVWVELSTGDKETLPITKDGKKDKSGFSSTYPAVRNEMYALIRDNLYTDAQWNQYCAPDHNETWSHRDWDADWSQLSIGDTFLLVGYSTDSKKLHYATFLLTGVSSNQLVGICVDHFTEDDSTVPPPYLHSKTTTYGLSASESSQPTSWGAYSAPTSTNRFAWQKDSYVYTESEKGRNLLRGTADMVLDTASDRTTKSWERGKFYLSGSNGTVTRDTSQSLPTALVGVKSCFKITSTSSNTIGFAQGELTMKVGYVKMSFWVKGTSGTSIYIQPGWDSAADRLAWKSATDQSNASYTTTLQNSNWTRLTYSAYIHTAASTWRLGYVYLTTANKTIYVTGVKVEYGDIPTDWSRAPEDYNKDDVRVVEIAGADAPNLGENLINYTGQPLVITSNTTSNYNTTTRWYSTPFTVDGLNIPDNTPLSGQMRIKIEGCSNLNSSRNLFVYLSQKTSGGYPKIATALPTANGTYEVKRENFTVNSGGNGWGNYINFAWDRTNQTDVTFGTNAKITIDRVKLEIGSRCTAWSLSEHDKTAVSVFLESPVAIFTQNVTTNVVSSEKPKTNIIVTRGGAPVPLSDYTVAKPSTIPSDVNCNYTVTDSISEKSVEITSIWTAETIEGVNYPEEQGYAPIRVTYQGQTYDLNFKFYCNAMGKFKRTVEGDVETSIANKTWYEYNPATGQYDKTTTLGEFVRSSSKNTSVLTEKTNGAITSMSEILQRVDGISFKVYDDSNVVDLFTHDADIPIKSSMSSTGTIPTVASSVNVRTICVSIPVTMRRDVTTSIAMQIQTKASSSGSVIENLVHTFPITNGVLTTSNNKGRLDVLEEYTDSNKNYLRGVLYFEKTFNNDFKVVVVQARYTGTDAETVFLKSRNFLVGGISMKAGLKATGIDIEAGKIINTADRWECQTNNGVKTAWLDDMGNFTIRGVYNNLITVIDSTNVDKYIIGIPASNPTAWYLDVLLCGTFVKLEALPSRFSGMLNLPYYANDNLFTRGYTRYLDVSTSTPRQMKSDELRMLAGRKMVISWSTAIGANNDTLGYVFAPEVHYGSGNPTIEHVKTRMQSLMCGQKHFIGLGTSITSAVNRSPALNTPRTMFLSFELVKFHPRATSPGYSWGYIWTADDDSSQAAQSDGLNWT